MRKFDTIHIVLITSIYLLILSSCDRANETSSKLTIQLPRTSQSFQKTSDVSALADWSSTTPSSLSSFNCYMIMVGGPDPILNNNVCGKKSGGALTTPMFNIGLVAGAGLAGQSLELDVPPGPNRVVTLIGFQALNTAACQNYKSPGFDQSNLSKPFILGKSDPLTLVPNSTVNVPITMSFDSNAWFDECQGPAFNDANQNRIASQIVLRKFSSPKSGTIDTACNSIDIELHDSNNRTASANTATIAGLDAYINGSSTPNALITSYSNFLDCSGGTNSATTFTIPAGDTSIKRWIKPSLISGSITSLVLKVNLSQTSLAAESNGSFNLTNGSATNNAIEMFGPMFALPNICYKYDLASRQFDRTPNTSDTSTISLTAAPESNIYSDTNCSTPVSIDSTNPNSSKNYSLTLTGGVKSFYVKFNNPSSETAANQNFNVNKSGYLSGYHFTQISMQAPVTTPSRLSIKEDAVMAKITYACYGPFRLSLSNNSGAEVIAASNRTINLTGTIPTNMSFLDGSCSGSPITTSTTILSGSSYTVFYIKFAATPPSVGTTQITFSDSVDSTINFLFKFTVN